MTKTGAKNKNNRIVLSGYYGYGNIGDEAVLDGIVDTLAQTVENSEIVVLSGNCNHTMLFHPDVRAIPRYNFAEVFKAIASSDLLISGGGSLLQDATSVRSSYYYLFILRLAQILRRKTMVYAQGLGPLTTQKVRNGVAKTLNRVNAITLRDPESIELLKEIGVNKPSVYLSADPTFIIEPDVEGASVLLDRAGLLNKDLMAITIRQWKNIDESIDAIGESIKSMCSELNLEPVLIPMQEPDDTQISDKLGIGTILNPLGNTRVAKGVIKRCKIVVGMRLHSLIFAADCCVPFVPIVYDPKIAAFSRITGQHEGVDVSSVEIGNLVASIRRVWSERETLSRKLSIMREILRERALLSGKIAYELLK